MDYNQFLEFKNLGFNPMTVVAMIVILFAFAEAWGVAKQRKKIILKQSGRSIANIMFILIAFVFVSFLIYGIKINSIVLILNGLLFLFYFPLVIGLYKYKGFTKLDKSVFISCVIGIALMLILQEKAEKELILSIFISASLLASISQPLELIKEKDPGAVEIKLIIVFAVSNIFWIIFSTVISEVVLIVTFWIEFLIIWSIIFLWFYYKKKKDRLAVLAKNNSN